MQSPRDRHALLQLLAPESCRGRYFRQWPIPTSLRAWPILCLMRDPAIDMDAGTYFFLVSRMRGAPSRVKIRISSPVTVLMS